MLAPRHPAAVVAGNVETSQAVTGALYAALGAQAEGSGTMNNLTFGNDRYQYYETIASGSGAGDGFDGTDVVQTHMTNSRLTDPRCSSGGSRCGWTATRSAGEAAVRAATAAAPEVGGGCASSSR